MKHILILTFAFILFVNTRAISQTSTNTTIMSGGTVRSFRTYVPAIYTGQEARPLVLQFHGSGGTSLSFQNLTNFRAVADTANFILVTPQGTVFPQWGFTDWNGYISDTNGLDDALFVEDMLDTLIKQYNIDTSRIYTSGWSAGGFFSNYLGWKLGHRIAAAGSVSGGMTDTMLQYITPPRPFSYMEIHGTEDPVVPYEGGLSVGQVLLHTDTVIQFWIKSNECNLVPTISDMPNTNVFDGCTAQRFVWANGACGTEVQLLKITGGRHGWPNWTSLSATCKDFYADIELWRFFLNHSLECEVSNSIEVELAAELVIWPNPTRDVLHFDSSRDQNMNQIDAITITDMYGRILLRKDLAKQQQSSLDISEFPSGGYFIIFQSEGYTVKVNRFVIVK
jgi:polyhydroxybutyrate depolymerase